uniref:uncharacterized protein LOC127061425 isoform X1 n=1 Tax=Vespula vulgaris TaxID=7454 RepID=UPI0021280B47|nr:uncharacterized protein LOC127061425 isoform X1 [Vespula vulgaris]XP_050844229.1 uncharacterized protein LOC127061425 isoform X1 [Vespula vulgaris]XP_050844230.1 uncharacterized protein LOC127061425 isoform X1 [Vespula vulgaris]
MIKMLFSLITCAWLITFGVLTNLSHGEQQFYKDAVREAPRDISALKQFAEYIANQNLKQHMHHSYLLPLLISQIHKKYHLDLSNQEVHEIFKSLKGKFHLDDRLREQKLIPGDYISQIQRIDRKQPLPGNDYTLLYYGFIPLFKSFNTKLSYQDNKIIKENRKYRNIDIGYLQEKRQSLYNAEIEDNADKDIIANILKKHLMLTRQIIEKNKDLISSFAQVPKFTYFFDDPNLKEKYPFIQPNDPRYYENTIFSLDTKNNEGDEELTVDPISSKENILLEQTTEKQLTDVEIDKYDAVKNITVGTLMEEEKSGKNRPFIVSIAQDLNNDIYFIAVIAGCSAAAMFICVLISLTWCRLQRGAKAAADIEYPAYGVTGPNKDISPSEDQRLAQSAQMYHFQHQKQQIIAMENRTSTTRDPGSLSEAESDEENEEGDYTVYECPGLAATSEMEVKNPLFHDDPTPATPAHTNKEEDHK